MYDASLVILQPVHIAKKYISQIIVLPDDGLPVANNEVEAKCAENVDCSFSYRATTTPQLLQVQVWDIALGIIYLKPCQTLTLLSAY